MELEHLQMIINAMRDATEGAFWLAVLWMGKSYASMFVWFLFGVLAVRAGVALAKTLSDGKTERTRAKDGNEREKNDCVQAFFSMLRADPEYKQDGYHSDYIHDSDLRRIHKIFAEGCVTIKERMERKAGSS